MTSPKNKKINIAIIDDHVLFIQGLTSLLDTNYNIILKAYNGKDLIEKLTNSTSKKLPDLFIIDIQMPIMDGFETVKWLKNNYENPKIIILSMMDNQDAIIKMLKMGVNSYLTKASTKETIFKAIEATYKNDNYYTEYVISAMVNYLKSDVSLDNKKNIDKEILKAWEFLNGKEKQFIWFCCTELTNAQIAEKMFLSPRTIETFRVNLYEKFGVKTRTGLVMKIVQNNLIEIDKVFDI